METDTIFWLILFIIIGVAVAYFQYYFKQKNQANYVIALFCLKALSMFLLLLMLLNPEITSNITENKKPKLFLLSDQSKSIAYFKDSETLDKDISTLLSNNKLNEKFDISHFTFGNGIQKTDSLSYSLESTNIYKALTQTQNFAKEDQNAIVLLTDGNQTNGNSLEYIRSKNPVFPVIYGDTTIYNDLAIEQVNTNRFSFLNNNFPIEILVSYNGDKTINSIFRLQKNGKTVYRRKLNFSSAKQSEIITTNLKSDKIGVQYFKAEILPITSEKNIKNNQKDFSIEVIDEQSKIGLFSTVVHPDIGALKRAIESNKQRKVELINPEKDKFQINDFELVILYQPNIKFQSLVDAIKKDSRNYILVSGTATDWSFINKMNLGIRKQVLSQKEDFLPKYNSNFLGFYQEDIGFNDFPPLSDLYGRLVFSQPYESFLFQSINGIESEQPLLASLTNSNQKALFILGEGLWKWRSFIFRKQNNFEEFDQFVNTLVQYSAQSKDKSRLIIDYEALYPANSNIVIQAEYLDETLKFDPRVNLEMKLTNKDSKKEISLPFSLKENIYELEVNNLDAGNYEFRVSVIGTNVSKRGRFSISEYSVEEQFSSANRNNMATIATNTNGKVYYKNQINSLIDDLVQNNSFYTVQKVQKTTRRLIEWQWILFVIVSLLSLEWFIRKYFGKI